MTVFLTNCSPFRPPPVTTLHSHSHYIFAFTTLKLLHALRHKFLTLLTLSYSRSLKHNTRTHSCFATPMFPPQHADDIVAQLMATATSDMRTSEALEFVQRDIHESHHNVLKLEELVHKAENSVVEAHQFIDKVDKLLALEKATYVDHSSLNLADETLQQEDVKIQRESAAHRAMLEVTESALELFYYWVNFAPLSRGTSATGYAALYAIFLASGHEIVNRVSG